VGQQITSQELELMLAIQKNDSLVFDFVEKVPGGARGGQEKPGGARGSPEEPGGARVSQEEPGGARRSLPREPWVHLPCLSPGCPWPSKNKHGIYF
jgi:hypothetical protein